MPPVERFLRKELIDRGWSGDRKYRVTRADGTECFLRISPIERYEDRRALHEVLQQVAALGVPMCVPIEVGVCPDGVYSLQSWIEGQDLRDVLPSLPGPQQYALGRRAGEILRVIHMVPARADQEPWASRYNRKVTARVARYRECAVHFEGDEHVIAYLEANRGLLEGRPQCFEHGDYHDGNMMLEGGELRIIDFDRYDYGDPWEDFNRLVWTAGTSPQFASGQIHAYFGGDPPPPFFPLLAYYLCLNAVSSIPWAIPFGRPEVQIALEQARGTLAWFDDLRTHIPAWYLPVWTAVNRPRGC